MYSGLVVESGHVSLKLQVIHTMICLFSSFYSLCRSLCQHIHYNGNVNQLCALSNKCNYLKGLGSEGRLMFLK